MNERIRELSYEAQRYALNNTTGPDLAGLHELWQEKFAELIVKECMKVCESVDEADIRYRYDYRRGVLDCADAIQQYFGVEE